MSVIFLDSFFEDSIQNPNFFNGRVLTATDLRDLQQVNRERSRRLGQAVGEGVAYGLAITGSGDSLTITDGLAVNRQGDALRLPGKVTLKLVGIEPALAASDSPFVPCGGISTVKITGKVSAEFSLLAMTGATRFSDEFAPYDSLNGATGKNCSLRRYEEEGVQFKLIPLTASDFDLSLTGSASLHQSQWAALGLGIPAMLPSSLDPRKMPASYGLADTLRDKSLLSECDVPLAIVRYANSAVQWIDMWAVRRPCSGDLRALAFPSIEGDKVVERFIPYASQRRIIEGRAMLLQFQNQLEQLRRAVTNPRALRAADHFTYLPAVGYLPSTSERVSTGRRFDPETFFGATLPRATINPAYVRDMFNRALTVEPVIVGEEMPLMLYEVVGSDPDDPYIIFARIEPTITVPDEPDIPGVETGNLEVRIDAPTGMPLQPGFVSSVTASSRTTGNMFNLVLQQDTTSASALVYRVNNIPAGSYLITVAPSAEFVQLLEEIVGIVRGNLTQNVSVSPGSLTRATIDGFSWGPS